MSEYDITITRRVPNPDYKPRPFDPYAAQYATNREPEPPMYSSERVITASLTEDEYTAVKRALLEHWGQS